MVWGSVQHENGRKALLDVRVPLSEPGGCTKLFCPAAFRPATRLESNPGQGDCLWTVRGLAAAAAFAPYSAKSRTNGPSFKAVDGKGSQSGPS